MNGLLEIFYEDHEHALSQLNGLEKQLQFIQQGGEVEKAKIHLISFSRFLEIALDIHFVQEEEALFPFLVQKMGPNGPVAVMEHEHEDLRAAQMKLKEELSKDEINKEIVLHHGSLILNVLRDHIMKENQVLFPLSQQVLSEEDWEKAEKIAGKIALGQK